MTYSVSDGWSDLCGALDRSGVPMAEPEDEEDVEAFTGSALDVISVLKEAFEHLQMVLKCAELNQDSLEPETVVVLGKANTLIAEINDLILAKEKA